MQLLQLQIPIQCPVEDISANDPYSAAEVVSSHRVDTEMRGGDLKLPACPEPRGPADDGAQDVTEDSGADATG